MRRRRLFPGEPSESGRVGQRTRLDGPSGQSPCVEFGEGPLQLQMGFLGGLSGY